MTYLNVSDSIKSETKSSIWKYVDLSIDSDAATSWQLQGLHGLKPV